MIPNVRVFCGLLMAIIVVLLGCPAGPPKSDPMVKGVPHHELLKRLTAMDEAERFEVLELAKQQLDQVTIEEIEATLTELRQKNLSTLIYVCIQTHSELLYELKPPALQTLENSAGSFPNLAYYYARVDPTEGLKELFRLYDQQPDQRLFISLAIGEVCLPEASDFLLSQARSIKSAGGNIRAQLAGLKRSCTNMKAKDVQWILAQKLEREEIIALSDLALAPGLPPESLKALWLKDGQQRFFAIQVILGDPDTHFEPLRWMIAQYLQAGDRDTVRQILFSDSLRSVSAQRVVDFREATLAQVRLPKTEQKDSDDQ
jgi:hypothetical protein